MNTPETEADEPAVKVPARIWSLVAEWRTQAAVHYDRSKEHERRGWTEMAHQCRGAAETYQLCAEGVERMRLR